jgi:hypothetical protein
MQKVGRIWQETDEDKDRWRAWLLDNQHENGNMGLGEGGRRKTNTAVAKVVV